MENKKIVEYLNDIKFNGLLLNDNYTCESLSIYDIPPVYLSNYNNFNKF